MSELAGLDFPDVVLAGPVPYIRIRLNRHRGVKEDASRRDVPLIGLALDAAKRAIENPAGEGLFFVRTFVEGSASHQVARIIDAAGVRSGRLVAHSFRHSMETALLSANVNRDLANVLMGRTVAGSAKHYLGNLSLERLRDALSDGIDRLGDIETRQFEPEELFIAKSV
jgi:integrase